ncbi:MAG TPA: type II secretion system protein [Patescibacteria group bacterium]|nr:type II secretion system protein [Patescibacteria group bacterium]
MTLTEILVVVAALGVLILLTVFAVKPSYQIAKARDGRRKSDLKKIVTAVEDYGGDHPCYPVQVYQDANTCRPAADFTAYLNPVPCDPLTKKPYVYQRLDPNCKQYAIYATLELEKVITYGADKGNYVVSNIRLETTTITPGTTPGGGTSPPADFYGCFSGVCQQLSGSEQCSPNYIYIGSCIDEACCQNKCGTPEEPLRECN